MSVLTLMFKKKIIFRLSRNSTTLFNNDIFNIVSAFRWNWRKLWRKLKIRNIRKQMNDVVVLNNERSNRLNPDVILATTIDRTVILATVELSAQLGSEMKKYIARHGAETSGWTNSALFLSFFIILRRPG